VRYKKARALGKERFEKAIREDQALLGSLGMGLLSVENGLRLIPLGKVGKPVNPWDVVHMSPRVWGWLRPLLVELVKRRGREVSATGSDSVAEQGASPYTP